MSGWRVQIISQEPVLGAQVIDNIYFPSKPYIEPPTSSNRMWFIAAKEGSVYLYKPDIVRITTEEVAEVPRNE
jgi:hypothetical protein